MSVQRITSGHRSFRACRSEAQAGLDDEATPASLLHELLVADYSLDEAYEAIPRRVAEDVRCLRAEAPPAGAEPVMSLVQRAATQVDAEGYFIDAEGDRVDDLDQSDLDSE